MGDRHSPGTTGRRYRRCVGLDEWLTGGNAQQVVEQAEILKVGVGNLARKRVRAALLVLKRDRYQPF